MTPSNNLAGLSNYDLEQRRKAASARVEIAGMNTGSPDAVASEDLFNARMDVYDAACARLEALRSEQGRRSAMRWAGLPDMLRDAFTSGACSFGDFCPDFLDEVEKGADEYVAEVMGGQS